MPIKIQDDLPACKILEDEHIFVMTERRALTQDIRPLKILLLNFDANKNRDGDSDFKMSFQHAFTD